MQEMHRDTYYVCSHHDTFLTIPSLGLALFIIIRQSALTKPIQSVVAEVIPERHYE